jgi:hypothetical protein
MLVSCDRVGVWGYNVTVLLSFGSHDSIYTNSRSQDVVAEAYLRELVLNGFVQVR